MENTGNDDKYTQLTGVVDLSEEVDVVRVVSTKLGRDPRDTETSGHGKVGNHSNSQDQTREPVTCQYFCFTWRVGTGV